MQIGDKVTFADTGFSFEGEVAEIIGFIGADFVKVKVPSYTADPDCCGTGWTIPVKNCKLLGFWNDRLEAEKELEELLGKYKLSAIEFTEDDLPWSIETEDY